MNGVQFFFASTVFCGAFLVICLYFDKHRHEDPHFRKKLKVKRRKPLTNNEKGPEILNVDEIQDKEAVILKEIQSAETFMTAGDYQNAVVHFANAIACCVDPYNLLSALKRSLPHEVYVNLVETLEKGFGDQMVKLQNNAEISTLLDNKITELCIRNKNS
ncbi:hypothetical protein RI129_008525 [Pyrocoelia pectoralis]|uniref:Mitochondrial import receptor subunit TOM20 n=1 Tax=Pyrocoelia pectoralis TaxID=417401 RepID=A0AAN7V8S2_9COLE